MEEKGIEHPEKLRKKLKVKSISNVIITDSQKEKLLNAVEKD